MTWLWLVATVLVIPVSWPNVPLAAMTADDAKEVCRPVAELWNLAGKGVITVNCTGQPTQSIPIPWVTGNCADDWTGAIADAPLGTYPAYLNLTPGCIYAQGRLGQPGMWTHGGQLPHEFGHNLGLLHTCQFLSCPDGMFRPEPASGCTFIGYAAGFDVMGTGIGVNAVHAAFLGIPPSARLVSPGKSVSLDAGPVIFSRPESAYQYWVEYYAPTNLVYINYTGQPGFGLCDAIFVGSLTIGQSWRDPLAGITITRTDIATVAIISVPPLRTETPTPIAYTSTPTVTPAPQPTPTPTLVPRMPIIPRRTPCPCG